KDFSGAKDATDDVVDAVVHLVVKAIQLSATGAMLPTDWTPERVDGMMLEGANEQLVDALQAYSPMSPAQTLTYFNALPLAHDDPFDGTCGRCVSHSAGGLCSRWNRQVPALG